MPEIIIRLDSANQHIQRRRRMNVDPLPSARSGDFEPRIFTTEVGDEHFSMDIAVLGRIERVKQFRRKLPKTVTAEIIGWKGMQNLPALAAGLGKAPKCLRGVEYMFETAAVEDRVVFAEQLLGYRLVHVMHESRALKAGGVDRIYSGRSKANAKQRFAIGSDTKLDLGGEEIADFAVTNMQILPSAGERRAKAAELESVAQKMKIMKVNAHDHPGGV